MDNSPMGLKIYVLWFILIAIVYPVYQASENVSNAIEAADSLAIVQQEVLLKLDGMQLMGIDTTLQIDQ